MLATWGVTQVSLCNAVLHTEDGKWSPCSYSLWGAQSHRVARTHRHTVTQCQTLTPTLASLTFSPFGGPGAWCEPQTTSRPWERGREPGEAGGRGPISPRPLGGVQSSGAEHWSHLFLSVKYGDTSQSKWRAERRVLGGRRRRAPPTLSPAGGVACLSPPLGLSKLPRGGLRRGPLSGSCPVPPLKKGAEGGPALSRFPRVRTLRDLAAWPSRRLPSSAPPAGPGSPRWLRRCKQA